MLGDQVMQSPLQLVRTCEKLCENQGWLPSTREQDFKSLLISFSLFDTYFLKVGGSITFNKTYWMMQVVS